MGKRKAEALEHPADNDVSKLEFTKHAIKDGYGKFSHASELADDLQDAIDFVNQHPDDVVRMCAYGSLFSCI